MRPISFALVLAAGILAGAGTVTAENASCQVQLQRQDEQCQLLAEKLAAACPGGQNIRDHPECRQISATIADTCTRKPCAPAKAKSKSKGKKSKGMGKSTAKGMGKPDAKTSESK